MIFSIIVGEQSVKWHAFDSKAWIFMFYLESRKGKMSRHTVWNKNDIYSMIIITFTRDFS